MRKDVLRDFDSSHCSVAAPLTFGSLFAGVGGIDLGLERAGMQCKWQVEINPFARAGTMRNGIVFPREPLVPRTKETGFSFAPTPRAADYKGACKPSLSTAKRVKNGMANLPEYCQEIGITGRMSIGIPEWMMGFPIGWSELEVTATQSCHR